MKENCKFGLVICVMLFLTNVVFAVPLSYSNTSWNANSGLYLSIKEDIAFPQTYSLKTLVDTGLGFGGSVEMGACLKGWLITGGFNYIQYPQATYDPLVYSLFGLKVNGNFAKLFNNASFPSMPTWFSFKPILSGGVQWLNAYYFEDENAKTDLTLSAISQMVPYAGLSLDFEFGNNKGLTPFVMGTAQILFSETLSYNFEAAVGCRAVLGKRNVVYQQAPKLTFKEEIEPVVEEQIEIDYSPVLTLNILPDLFSPDGDWINDIVTISLKADLPANDATIQNWSVVITDIGGNEFFSFNGEGQLPESLEWQGKGKNGDTVISASDYPCIFTVTDSLGNTSSVTKTISVDILVEKNGQQLKILVPSIEFDADHATFDKISQDRIDNNQSVLDRVAKALKKYSKYNVLIQGHAHNIKGTEKEEEDVKRISLERAEKIKQELILRGIDENRLSVEGVGSKYSISNKLEEAWKNRRVEFILNK